MIVLFDITEFLAVFLLAVEAIKLENLKVLVEHFLTPLASRLNPKITFVDDVSNVGFLEKNAFNLMLLTFYVFGVFIILRFFHIYNFELFALLKEAAPMYWVLSILGLLFVPLIVGFLPYQIIVWFLEYSIKGLTWVQLKTHTGAVGVLGFLLFTLQFLGRRVWLS